MALLYFNRSPLFPFSPHSLLSNLFPSKCHGDHHLEMLDGRTRSKRRKKSRNFVVSSTHSNARILKSNRRTVYGQTLSPYDEEEVDENYEDDDDSEEELQSSEDEYEKLDELQTDRKALSFSSKNIGTSTKMLGQEQISPEIKQISKSTYSASGVIYGMEGADKRPYALDYDTNDRTADVGSLDIGDRGKVKNERSAKNAFHQLSEDFDFDEKWFPLIDYLMTFGLKESHFIQIYERHMPCLQLNVASAQERLEYLLSVGVKHKDIRKILLRQPQILEYTVENNLRPHVLFLLGLGIPDSRVGHVITAAPSLFSYSVEQSLKPTIRYLVEEVGIQKSDLSKVVQLSPQILVQRIDNSWTSRFGFLSKELGAPRQNIVKMVTKHPQLLHYSIEDGILPRINFLRSIGMQNSDILKVLTSLTQVLSLSLEDNLRPKYLYLVHELHNEVKSLTKYPMYLSLSLEQRIRPRHKFLVALKKAPKGPFPLGSFVPTDEMFCRQWAGTSVDKYLAFRQSLLLSQFAKKYQRK
ncbi:transcription termination factor MTERF9, chloroplastic isoform X1 [Aristolochia californica]|uniref:transcription termination factor MTERF9, chloroplastic isoform X1 n=1 Tax=Aristolochia californica TaxID=171875 RepID=UPI0035DDDC5D